MSGPSNITKSSLAAHLALDLEQLNVAETDEELIEAVLAIRRRVEARLRPETD